MADLIPALSISFCESAPLCYGVIRQNVGHGLGYPETLFYNRRSFSFISLLTRLPWLSTLSSRILKLQLQCQQLVTLSSLPLLLAVSKLKNLIYNRFSISYRFHLWFELIITYFIHLMPELA